MPTITSRLEGLRSSSPSSPTPVLRNSMAGSHSKRHHPEAPAASRTVNKKRRLFSLAAAHDDSGNIRHSLGGVVSADDDAYNDGEDELSMLREPLPPPSSDHTAPSLATLHPSQPQGPEQTPPAATAAASEAPRGPPLGHRVASFGTYLLAHPPQSVAPGSEVADAGAQVAMLQGDYKIVEAKLAVARARLTEQLTSFDAAGGGISTTTTPASLRPGSAMPVAVHVDEDDAVASALAHINNLESRRAGLLSRLHQAQASELGARQQRDGRQLSVQVENARLFRRLVDLGPTGAASVFRVLLKAAGVSATDDLDSDDAGTDAAERRAVIKQELDDDILREGLLPASSAAPAGHASRSQATTNHIGTKES